MSAVSDPHLTRVRVLRAAVAVAVAILATRLWYLQVLEGGYYRQAALTNMVKLVYLPAPRGRILDRTGRPLADVRPSWVVRVSRDPLPGQEILNRLAGVLGITPEELKRRLDQASARLPGYAPAVVAQDVPEEKVFYLAEHEDEFPGVEADTVPVRTYALGSLAANVLGYVGEIGKEGLEAMRARGLDYRPGDVVGQYGLEAQYETDLHGKRGTLKLLVNAAGRVLRELGREDPVPGNDLVLTLDGRIQALAEESLDQTLEAARSVYDRDSGKRLAATGGAVVVLDPKTGGVLALASRPTFDPNEFVLGMSAERWKALTEGPERPLFDRAVAAALPPGSTFKVVTAAAALSSEVFTPSTTVKCPGFFKLGNQTFRDWLPSGHGSVSLRAALVESCDVYFYTAGSRLYELDEKRGAGPGGPEDALPAMARAFGFGRPTGIDLPEEQSGLVPDRAWLRQQWERNRARWCREYAERPSRETEERCLRGWRWYPGYSVNMAIGQGDLAVTPLQLAVAYAALANGGTIYRPHLVQKVVSPSGAVIREVTPKVGGTLPVPPSALAAIRASLAGVTRPPGTAAGAFLGFPLDRIPVAGKTGTAERQGKQPTSWFAAFAPADDPQYVVVAMVEEGGHGAETAAPLVRRVLQGIFGLEPTPVVPGARAD